MLRIRLPPRSTLTYKFVPSTTLFRSRPGRRYRRRVVQKARENLRARDRRGPVRTPRRSRPEPRTRPAHARRCRRSRRRRAGRRGLGPGGARRSSGHRAGKDQEPPGQPSVDQDDTFAGDLERLDRHLARRGVERRPHPFARPAENELVTERRLARHGPHPAGTGLPPGPHLHPFLAPLPEFAALGEAPFQRAVLELLVTGQLLDGYRVLPVALLHVYGF